MRHKKHSPCYQKGGFSLLKPQTKDLCSQVEMKPNQSSCDKSGNCITFPSWMTTFVKCSNSLFASKLLTLLSCTKAVVSGKAKKKSPLYVGDEKGDSFIYSMRHIKAIKVFWRKDLLDSQPSNSSGFPAEVPAAFAPLQPLSKGNFFFRTTWK